MKTTQILLYLLFCFSASVTFRLASSLGAPSRTLHVNIALGASGLRCQEGHLACRAGESSERADLASLEVLRTWHSTKARPAWSITLVTQLSANR